MQLIFVLTLTLLYLLLEQSQFINAVDVFRPGVGLIVCVNLAGIFCAVCAFQVPNHNPTHSPLTHQLAGVCLQQNQLISIQITLLLGLVCLSDLLAFVLGMIRANQITYSIF